MEVMDIEMDKIRESQKTIVITLSAMQQKGLVTNEEVNKEYKRLHAPAARKNAGLDNSNKESSEGRPDESKETGSVEDSGGD